MTGDASQPPPLPAPRRRWRFWALLIAMTAGVVYVFVSDPMAAWSLPCVFYETTGLYCAGCGLTRSMHALTHGRVAEAVAYNPLMTFVVPVVCVRLLMDAWSPNRRRRLLPAAWVWTLLIVLAAFWIARNLPWYPFTLLAP